MAESGSGVSFQAAGRAAFNLVGSRFTSFAILCPSAGLIQAQSGCFLKLTQDVFAFDFYPAVECPARRHLKNAGCGEITYCDLSDN
jgi:hypothetical protein